MVRIISLILLVIVLIMSVKIYEKVTVPRDPKAQQIEAIRHSGVPNSEKAKLIKIVLSD